MGRPAKYADDFPSVTQIIGALFPQEWKAYWFAKTVGHAAAELIVSHPAGVPQPHDLPEIIPGEVDSIDAWTKWLTRKGAIDRSKVVKESTDVGSAVHGALEKWLKGIPFDECVKDMSRQQVSMLSRFTSQLADRKLEMVGIEEPMKSDKLKLNGTPDLIARENKTLKVFDWKTSKKIDAKPYSYQMGGYAVLALEKYGEMPQEGEVWRVGKDLEIDEPLVVPNLAVWASKFLRMRDVYADIYGK